ncbi:MAG: diadenylate cyclase CdaA, partial [Treponema sp.]|nr:diadenylate cyclase CdaA [Treponema sp.]
MAWIQRLFDLYDFLRPVLDVALLAFLLYKGYQLLARTQAIQLLKGAGLLGLLYGAAYFLRLNTLQWALGIIAPGLFIVVAIVFQPELRKIFMHLGRTEFFRPNAKPSGGQIDAVLTAAELLSRRRRGMIAVFERRSDLRGVSETGTRLNAEISSSLIVSLFEYDGPLHDGAVVIQGGRIVAAGCFLPLSDQQGIGANFGSRHRASLGISEQSDAAALVVSEETGAISIAVDSRLYYDLSLAEA